MAADAAVEGTGIHPSAHPSRGRDREMVLASMAVGIGAILATFQIARPRLPVLMAVHFAADGVANGWASPWSFTLGGVGLEMAIGVLFVAVLHGMLASPVLWQRYGAGPQRVVVGVAVLTTGISIPLGWVAADLSAAGEWPFGALNVAGISGVGAAVVVIGALTLTARAFGRNGSGAIERSRTHRSTAPIRFQCTSCGQDIGAPSWWPVHPRIGGPGGASYSFRCSRCGERGWQHRIA